MYLFPVQANYTQCLMYMIREEGEAWPMCKADNLTSISEPIIQKDVGASTSHNPIGIHGLLQG
jgi:hypothetical protein